MLCNNKINKFSRGHLFNDVNAIPYNKVGLLLGTSKYLSKGVSNPYFENRIKAAEDLYHAGKIKYIVISGDNSFVSYNEPRDMRKKLLTDSIPDSCIFLDFAGFRTFDSVIRCKEIFGQEKFTVISQQFHNERAIYISSHYNIDAIGFDAEDVGSYNGFMTNVRELFARVKVFIDIFITHEQPKFLGEKISIP
jgi:SanA protein